MTTASGSTLTILAICHGDSAEAQKRLLQSLMQATVGAETGDLWISCSAVLSEILDLAHGLRTSEQVTGLVETARPVAASVQIAQLLPAAQTDYILLIDQGSSLRPGAHAALHQFAAEVRPLAAGEICGVIRPAAYRRLLESQPWWKGWPWVPDDQREMARSFVPGCFLTRTELMRAFPLPHSPLSLAELTLLLTDWLACGGHGISAWPAFFAPYVSVADGAVREPWQPPAHLGDAQAGSAGPTLSLDGLIEAARTELRLNHPGETERLASQALELAPENPAALHLLGLALSRTGRQQQGVQLLARSIECGGQMPAYYNNYGNVLSGLKRFEEAVAAFHKALERRPDYPEALNNLGRCLLDCGRPQEALPQLIRACELRPTMADAWLNRANTLQQLNHWQPALAALEKCAELAPRDPRLRDNMAGVLRRLHRYDQALEQYQKAIQIAPSFSPAYHGLASLHDDLADPHEAIAWRRKMVALEPDAPQLHSDLLWSMLCVSCVSPEERFAEHLNWGRRHAEPLRSQIRPHANDRTPDRQLRIGYVSVNLGAQAIGWFMAPLLAAHDRKQVAVYCYSDIPKPDWMTQKIQGLSDRWRETGSLGPQELADLVRRDQIDILVDLRGHMGGNRLTTFARKPAPVQMSYIGYQYTTGIAAIDYRIADTGTDPEGMTEGRHVEQLLRLSRSAWCYQTPEAAHAVSPAPVARNGYITFGSFQKTAKLNRAVLETWCQILQQVPRSALRMLCPSPRTIERLRTVFTEHGVAPERIQPLFQTERNGYLTLFNEADLALDTFPYAGVTTTCDSLWMGLPVLSLVDSEPFARAGASLLPPCGLDEFMVDSVESYIRKAVELGQNPECLVRLRGELRDRMQASQLMDAPSLARDMEAAYRQAWINWIDHSA